MMKAVSSLCTTCLSSRIFNFCYRSFILVDCSSAATKMGGIKVKMGSAATDGPLISDVVINWLSSKDRVSI